MRINPKVRHLYISKFLKENPEYKDKGLYLLAADKGEVIATRDDDKISLRVRKVSQSDVSYAITNRVVVKYMMKYSNEYNYQKLDNGDVIFYPINKKGKTNGDA